MFEDPGYQFSPLLRAQLKLKEEEERRVDLAVDLVYGSSGTNTDHFIITLNLVCKA